MLSDKPFVALWPRHIQTLQIMHALFLSLKPPVLRKQPTEQPNFCLQSLHTRYSWEGAKKTVWWKLMSYAIKPVRGMLIIVCFRFVCLAFFPFFLSCLSLNGKLCCLIWGLLISRWYRTPRHLICTPSSWFKMFFCTAPRLTWQLISEGSNHWGSILSPIHPAALSKAISLWGSLNGHWRKGSFG